jgi:hypothetical protein
MLPNDVITAKEALSNNLEKTILNKLTSTDVSSLANMNNSQKLRIKK